MEVRHFDDMGYAVIAEPKEYSVDYRVFKILGHQQGNAPGVFDVPMYGNDLETRTTDIEQAEAFMSGFVKWDGCSNWDFEDNERCMFHGCDEGDLLNFGRVMAECWRLTADLLPTWDAHITRWAGSGKEVGKTR